MVSVDSGIHEREAVYIHDTVEPVLKDHPFGYKNVVCQERWSQVTGSVILKHRSFCQKCMVCQDRWSLMAAVSQDRFHCTGYTGTLMYSTHQLL